MTHDEIMKLEAGRELDALIEKEIFGRDAMRWKHLSKYGVTVDHVQSVEYGGPDEYSTDMDAAMSALESKRSELRSYWVGYKDYSYHCDLYPHDLEKRFAASADKPELAICLALLLMAVQP